MSIFAALLLAVAAQCTPEHAAMGHCKMPQAEPGPAPACTPEHAAMGHCKLPEAKAESDPKPAPACTPEHAAMGHCTLPPAPTPPMPSSDPEHAADAIWGAQEMTRARRAVYAEHGGFAGSKLLIDRLEMRARKGRDGYAFEGEAWFGGDYDRLWLKAGGEGSFGEAIDGVELQALYSRAIDPWFNLQAGLRHDRNHGPNRTHLALGIQGLAPYWFEIDAAAFLSTTGELTARVEAEYDQRLTNQLILQPRVELGLSAQDMPDLRTGAGLTGIEAGLRLRYEIVPELAPYIGVEWERALGRTANYARAAGERPGGWSFVAGIRAWF